MSIIYSHHDDPWPCSTSYVADVLLKPYDMENWSNWSPVKDTDLHFRIRGVYLHPTPCDFDDNGRVEIDDLLGWSEYWLNDNCNPCQWCKELDVNWSGRIDIEDLAVISEYWHRKY